MSRKLIEMHNTKNGEANPGSSDCNAVSGIADGRTSEFAHQAQVSDWLGRLGQRLPVSEFNPRRSEFRNSLPRFPHVST